MQKKHLLASALLAGTFAMSVGCDKPAEEQAPKASAPATSAMIESDAVALPPPPKDSDIIATVGDKTMTWGELNKQVDEMVASYTKVTGQPIPSEMLPGAKQEFRHNIVQSFVVDTVIAKAAAEHNITLDEAFRAEQIKKMEAARGQKFDDLLKEFPLGEAKARDLLEKQWLELKLLETVVFAKITVSEEEITEEVNKATAESALVDAEMADYAKQIADGTATFEDLVQANSVVKQASPIPVNQLQMLFPTPEAQATIASTKTGELSPVIELPGAKGIFKVVDRTAEQAADDASAKAKIDEVCARLAKGEDFAAVAKEVSDCPSGARAGGSLGEFGKGAMVPEFEKAVFAQPVGEIGQPVKTNFGYHVIRVDSRDDAAGKASASHILVASTNKPATITLLPLIKQVPMVRTAEEIREEKTEMQKRKAALDFFNTQKKKVGVSSTLFPELTADPTPTQN